MTLVDTLTLGTHSNKARHLVSNYNEALAFDFYLTFFLKVKKPSIREMKQIKTL